MIHPTAKVDASVQIGAGVTIGAFCNIGKGVTIQNGVTLEPHVNIKGHTNIDENTHIFPFAEIGNDVASVRIGKRCHIREFTKIGICCIEDTKIEIKDDCYIMAYADIRSAVVIDQSCIITNNVVLHSNSRCGPKVIIGAKATVAKNCIVGTGSMIGGVSTVKSNIPPFCLVEGFPLASIRGLNLIGMRRSFENRESISHVKKAFMHLKKSQFSASEAQKLLPSISDTRAKQFVEFIASH